MPRRYYSSTAVETTLTSGVSNSATTLPVASTSGFPGSTPYTLILDEGTVNEEVVTVTGVATLNLTVTRGVDGTSAVSHSNGATVKHGVSARDFDEPNAIINTMTTKGDLLTRSSSADVRLGVGTNGQALVADSAATPGIKWATLAASDVGAVANSLVSGTKGAVPVGTGSTVAALSPGSNGEVLYADSSATNGLRYQPVYATGRNRIINGGFDVWARGTSFSNPANSAYTADRFTLFYDGTGATRTISRQAFTAGTAPVAGYEGTYFYRYDHSVAGSGATYNNVLYQKVEDVRTFAGQNVTVSFWAKANSNRNVVWGVEQNFGSGGSSTVGAGSATVSLTTSWARYTGSLTMPSVASKTIGAGSFVGVFIGLSDLNTVQTIDVWGVQVEAGSVATRFEEEPYEATLRKCQRYYYRLEPGAASRVLGTGQATGTGSALVYVPFPTTLRTRPSALEQSGTASHYGLLNATSSLSASNSVPAYDGGTTADMAVLFGYVNNAVVAGNATALFTNNSAAYLAWSAEL